jgi:CYTH domain-containing protein
MSNNNQIEYEKTYLLKFIPDNLIKSPHKEIIDIYIPKNAAHPKLRIRKNGNNYEICKKYPVIAGDASQQHEFTIPISEDEFKELNSNLTGKRAKKYRYYYKYKDKIAEIDVFKDDLTGLILVDFEFVNKQEKDNFIPPEFCLADVTQETIVAGGMIVGKKYTQIESILAKYNYKPLFID